MTKPNPMIYLRLSSLFLFTLFLAGCSKTEEKIFIENQENPDIEEEPEVLEQVNETYFTLNVAPNWLSEDSIDNWIIIHDENGNLLDYSKYKNGDELSFEAINDSVSENLRITTLSYFKYTSEEKRNYYLNTYPNVPKNSIWNLKILSSTGDALLENPIIGKFNLKVDNIPGVKIHTLSVDNRINNQSANIKISESNSQYYQLNINEIDLTERDNYFLSILDGDNNLKYIFFDNIQNGENINLDYQDFKDFDSYLNIDLPPQQYLKLYPTVLAYPEYTTQTNAVYTFNHPYDSSYWNLGLDFIKIGYLNEFKKYEIRFELSLDGYSYNYVKIGSKTNNLSIPEMPNITYKDYSIYDFSFSTNTEYHRKTNTWKYNSDNSSTTWSIFSDSKSNLNFNHLPEEITNTYPDINIDAMKFNRSELYLIGESQTDFIKNTFVANDKAIEYEHASISISHNN